MPIEPFFRDRNTARLSVSGESIGDIAMAILKEALGYSERFRENYNGFFLLAEEVWDRAQALNLPRERTLAKFAKLAILLQTRTEPDFALDPEEEREVESLVGSEVFDWYRRQLKSQTSYRRLGVKFYPRIHALFEDLERSLSQFVFGPQYKAPFEIARDGLIVLVGSCFADNLGRFLGSLGFQVLSLGSAEEASPATFPDLMAAIASQPDYQGARDRISSSPNLCLVFTAGVGEQVRLGNGEVIEAARIKENPATIRSIEQVQVADPDTIAENLIKGFGIAKTLNPNAKMIATVSPVPLEATFEREFGIIAANAYSKAALMMGVRQACKSDPNFAYFPSYEIVKDWSVLAGIQPYAADDGQPRHVSKNLVFIICVTFIRHFIGESYYREVLGKFSISNFRVLRNIEINEAG